jgi:hypothetical protein
MRSLFGLGLEGELANVHGEEGLVMGARTVLSAEEHVLDVAHAVDVVESVCQGVGDR